MESDLEESNIEKNREFNKLAAIHLVISAVISVASFMTLRNYTDDGDIGTVLVVSIFITIGLFYWTFSGGQCPECAAKKHKEELEKRLVGENFLGHKFDSNNHQKRIISRIYEHDNICKYCGYKWTSRSTERKEED